MVFLYHRPFFLDKHLVCRFFRAGHTTIFCHIIFEFRFELRNKIGVNWPGLRERIK